MSKQIDILEKIKNGILEGKIGNATITYNSDFKRYIIIDNNIPFKKISHYNISKQCLEGMIAMFIAIYYNIVLPDDIILEYANLIPQK